VKDFVFFFEKTKPFGFTESTLVADAFEYLEQTPRQSVSLGY
jgi:hypothetical protein